MDAPRPNFRRQWLIPLGALTTIALVLFWSLYTLDSRRAANAAELTALKRYIAFDPASLTDALASLSGLIAAVFGIVVTVASIIVQLSAERYKGVTRMFLRDPVNIATMAFYVVACVCGVWLSVALKEDWLPVSVLMLVLVATTGGLVLMVPYFAYVFWFLEPKNIVERIRHLALDAALLGTQTASEAKLGRAQATFLAGMEELTDIVSNSISSKDKIIASGAVDALRDLVLGYLPSRPGPGSTWYRVGPQIATDPDFVAMDPESLADLEQSQAWVEWKVMRQYLGIYNDALGSMRDINYLIAIDTRYIGEAAARAQLPQITKLVFRFLNSYLRATLNARDVRTAYNVLNQYRLLVESLLKNGQAEAAVDGVRHMIYYGHVSFDMNLTFVTETVAYDIATLCQLAHDSGLAEEKRMLELFLELDRPLRTRSQEAALLGVRKAQAKLAAYYLLENCEDKARLIFADLKHEPPERRKAIHEALASVKTKEFWEITDRGRNFEFMPDEQREKLAVFFSWFERDPGSL
jgi:hypothetical protein